jgi:hypothetical protein
VLRITHSVKLKLGSLQRFFMMKARVVPQPPKVEVDPSGWLINNQLAQFMIMHTDEIKYMCMLGMMNSNANVSFNLTVSSNSLVHFSLKRVYIPSWGKDIQIYRKICSSVL